MGSTVEYLLIGLPLEKQMQGMEKKDGEECMGEG